MTPTHYRHRSTAESAGAAASRVIAPMMAKRGFPAASILADWSEIAGPELAACTTPERILWPQVRESQPQTKQRRLEGATLTIRVAGPRAIEVQHEADRIMERFNLHFGWRAVTSIRIVQGPVRQAAPAAKPRSPRGSSAQIPETPSLSGIRSEKLAEALGRLGSHVKSA